MHTTVPSVRRTPLPGGGVAVHAGSAAAGRGRLSVAPEGLAALRRRVDALLAEPVARPSGAGAGAGAAADPVVVAAERAGSSAGASAEARSEAAEFLAAYRHAHAVLRDATRQLGGLLEAMAHTLAEAEAAYRSAEAEAVRAFRAVASRAGTP